MAMLIFCAVQYFPALLCIERHSFKHVHKRLYVSLRAGKQSQAALQIVASREHFGDVA